MATFFFPLASKVYDCIEAQSKLSIQKKLKVYDNVNEFLDDHAGFADLTLENFQSMFIVYPALLLFYLFCFIAHRIWKRIQANRHFALYFRKFLPTRV